MNRRPSSSETGRSERDGVSDRNVFIFSILSAAMPVAAAISSCVGGRSSLRLQLALRLRDAVVRVDHVHGQAHRATLVGERAADRVADPPARVGREAEAAR